MRERRSLFGSFVLSGALLLVTGCGDKTTPEPDEAKAEETKPEAKTEEAKPEVEAEDEANAEDEKADEEGDTKTAEAEEGDDDTEDAKDPAGITPKPAGAQPTKTTPTGPTVGKTSTVVASAKAEAGYHCNDAYPHKFVTAGGSNVKYPDPKPKGGCAGKDAIAVSVPYIPTAAGAGSVSGTLKYGICDEAKTNCRIVKKQLTLPFTAGES